MTELKTLEILNNRRIEIPSQLSNVNSINNYFLDKIPQNISIGNGNITKTQTFAILNLT